MLESIITTQSIKLSPKSIPRFSNPLTFDILANLMSLIIPIELLPPWLWYSHFRHIRKSLVKSPSPSHETHWHRRFRYFFLLDNQEQLTEEGNNMVKSSVADWFKASTGMIRRSSTRTAEDRDSRRKRISAVSWSKITTPESEGTTTKNQKKILPRRARQKTHFWY